MLNRNQSLFEQLNYSVFSSLNKFINLYLGISFRIIIDFDGTMKISLD